MLKRVHSPEYRNVPGVRGYAVQAFRFVRANQAKHRIITMGQATADGLTLLFCGVSLSLNHLDGIKHIVTAGCGELRATSRAKKDFSADLIRRPSVPSS
jgi:hypothetical protein